jgi:hypothetical protein
VLAERRDLPDGHSLTDPESDPGFASEFDRELAASGPAAVFLPNREGLLKLEPAWTRDAWERAPGPHPPGWTWTLCRDRATGYVVLALVTSPSLLLSHPRLDLRRYRDREEAVRERLALGPVAIRREPW